MRSYYQIHTVIKGGCTQASACVCNGKSPKFKRPASTILAAKSSTYAHSARTRALRPLRPAATVAIATASISLLGRVELIAITLGSMNLDSYASTTIVSCARLSSD